MASGSSLPMGKIANGLKYDLQRFRYAEEASIEKCNRSEFSIRDA